MRTAQQTVDVRDGRMVITATPHIDLIRHVFDRGSDRELLKELYTRLAEVERSRP